MKTKELLLLMCDGLLFLFPVMNVYVPSLLQLKHTSFANTGKLKHGQEAHSGKFFVID